MSTVRIWVIAIFVCIAWAYDPDAPDEVETAQLVQDQIDDTAAQLVAARKGE